MISQQNIKQFHIYLADLSPQMGTEPGKTRPVVVVQTNLLNEIHPSTIICPITSKMEMGAQILRVHLLAETSGLSVDSDILVDQIRAIDNKRFIKHIGTLSTENIEQLKKNLSIIILT